MVNNNLKPEYSQNFTFKIDKEFIKNLNDLANGNDTKRSRLLIHSNADSKIHEMLIFFRKDSYIKPHKHINKTESYLILEGDLDVIYFNEDGSFNNKINLKNYSSGNTFFLRSENSLFHTLRIISDFVILIETTNGPAIKDETEYANWAPDYFEFEKVKQFQDKIKNY
jgi:cupin fold WbuC family metalloprotein